MALYNSSKTDYEKQVESTYQKLRKELLLMEKGKLNEFFFAYEKLVEMENRIYEQEKELENYRIFFRTMAQFLPTELRPTDAIF